MPSRPNVALVGVEVGARDRGGQAEADATAEQVVDDQGGGDGAVLLGVEDTGQRRQDQQAGAELRGGRERVDRAAAKQAAGWIGASLGSLVRSRRPL